MVLVWSVRLLIHAHAHLHALSASHGAVTPPDARTRFKMHRPPAVHHGLIQATQSHTPAGTTARCQAELELPVQAIVLSATVLSLTSLLKMMQCSRLLEGLLCGHAKLWRSIRLDHSERLSDDALSKLLLRVNARGV